MPFTIHPPNLEKTHFAAFSKTAYELAQAKNSLALKIFETHIPKRLVNQLTPLLANPKLQNQNKQSITIIAQGSVWKSWNLMQEKFKSCLLSESTVRRFKEIKLVQLPDYAGGLGAARLAQLHFEGLDFSKLETGTILDVIRIN